MQLEGYISNLPLEELDANGRIINNLQQNKPNFFKNISNKTKAILTNADSWLNRSDYDNDIQRQKRDIALSLATTPFGLGSKATLWGTSKLTPLLGNKIARMTAEGIGSGAIGGGVYQGLENAYEGKNPITGALNGATLGALFGGLGGVGLGKLNKFIDSKKLINNKPLQAQYFNDYIEGLSNNSPLGQRSLQNKEMANFRAAVNGIDKSDSGVLFDKGNPLHEEQLKIINKTNPAPDSYHTWIRTADDIHNFEDTLKPPVFDPDFIGNDFDPSYSWDMAQDAIKNGEIDIYSSYPIQEGVFVTPSPMEAESYSGTGKIYNKRVPLEDVAWIEATQGQYAPVNNIEQFKADFNNKVNSNWEGFTAEGKFRKP